MCHIILWSNRNRQVGGSNGAKADRYRDANIIYVYICMYVKERTYLCVYGYILDYNVPNIENKCIRLLFIYI